MITPTEQYNKELYHYGVVGMKWGIRRAKKRGETYQYKSFGQKHYEKKLAKQTAKGASAEKIAETKSNLRMTKARDKARQKYAESTTVGKSIAKGLLFGAVGSGNYNRLRAAGVSRGESAVVAMLGTYVVPGVGIVATKAYENRKTREKNKL